MDTGHFNCRDYTFAPHISTTTSSREPHTSKHESFAELEARSRSPEASKAKFPLMQLPLELRQQILTYLLPYTKEFKDSGRLSEHARNFSAVKKRGARGMAMPTTTTSSTALSNVVWQRGNIHLLRVCRQLHRECVERIYGSNTFLLFVTYEGIIWRFRWLLPSGLAPIRTYSFLEVLPARYLRLVKRAVVHVDHIDSYTSMIKHGVGAKGFKHGLVSQARRLVVALMVDEAGEERRLTKLQLLLKTDSPQKSAVNLLGCLVDGRLEKRNDNAMLHRRCAEASENLDEMLAPFGYLRGVREVGVGGAVSEAFASELAVKMKGRDPVDAAVMNKLLEEAMSMSKSPAVQLCVYGNDL